MLGLRWRSINPALEPAVPASLRVLKVRRRGNGTPCIPTCPFLAVPNSFSQINSLFFPFLVGAKWSPEHPRLGFFALDFQHFFCSVFFCRSKHFSCHCNGSSQIPKHITKKCNEILFLSTKMVRVTKLGPPNFRRISTRKSYPIISDPSGEKKGRKRKSSFQDAPKRAAGCWY